MGRARLNFARSALSVVAVGAVAIFGACDPGAGTGTVAVTITGEEAATEGLPFTEDGETIEFADGWAVTFDHYVVVVGNFAAGDVREEEKHIVDLATLTGDPPSLAVHELVDVPAGRQPFEFELPAGDDTLVALNDIPTDVLDRMKGGLTYFVSGTATKDARTVTFEMPLANPTRNANCTNGDDDKDGVVVTAGATTEAEITIHVEHVFFDTLGVEDPALVFEPLAALAGDDDALTAAELAAAPVDPTIYDRGTFTADNMLAFIAASAASQGHLNGDGLCTVTDL
jgi:hypothetical protein